MVAVLVGGQVTARVTGFERAWGMALESAAAWLVMAPPSQEETSPVQVMVPAPPLTVTGCETPGGIFQMR
jgi:hypothetical protein